MKVKDKSSKQKISKKGLHIKSCEVPDTTIFFSFQYITSDDCYNINFLKSRGSGEICKKDILANCEVIK